MIADDLIERLEGADITSLEVNHEGSGYRCHLYSGRDDFGEGSAPTIIEAIEGALDDRDSSAMTPPRRARVRKILACVDSTPRTATEIWRRYAKVHSKKSITKRERRERRWVASVLEQLTNEREILCVIESNERGQTWVAFRRPEAVDADARGDDQPRRTGSAGGARRATDGRSVVQRPL
jgi:hypothetical protein